ncbi:unnamed protein product [Diamesa hyperborea]
MDQQYCLRWHNHPSNLTGVLISLLQREALCDVTLAVEGETIKAHQTILSACSPYFESIFIQNSHPHPIMYLKDVGYEELKAIIEYMYKGEVNVAQRSLPKFLKTAEGLQVKGLTESNNMNYRPNNEDRNSVETPPITSSSNNINNNRSNYLNRERSNSERGRERSGSIIGDRTSSDKDPDDYRDINDHGKEIELSATIESRKRRKNSSSCDNLMTSLPERHFSDSQASSHSSYKLSPLPKPITMDEDVDGIGRRKSPASNQMNAMQQQHQISIKQETMSDASGASIQPNLNHNLFPQLQTQLPPPPLPTTMSNTNHAQLTTLNHNFNYSQNQQSSPGGSSASVNPNKRTASCFSEKEELDNLLRHTQMLYNSMNQRSLYEQKSNRRQDGTIRSLSPGPRHARNNFPGAFSINLGSMASASGSGTTTTTRKTGRFRPNWLEQFNWLQYDDVNNIMFCLFCRRWSNDIPDIRTSFVEGNSNFRLEIVNHHEKCKAHKMCRDRSTIMHPLMASRGHHVNPGGVVMGHFGVGGGVGMSHDLMDNGQTNGTSGSSRRDHNIDYSALFIQLSGTFPTLYRCVSCHKTVSNRWHHANIHRPQSHECPVCGQKFTRRDNMKAHCKVKHADMKDRYYGHFVHM